MCLTAQRCGLTLGDSSKDISLTGCDIFDGNEICIAFGKYMNIAYHTDTIDSLISKF